MRSICGLLHRIKRSSQPYQPGRCALSPVALFNDIRSAQRQYLCVLQLVLMKYQPFQQQHNSSTGRTGTYLSNNNSQ
jgi:hypothetical protein